MKKLMIISAAVLLCGTMSCSETTHEDNTTHDTDTMVIRENQTDSATNSVSTDTTKR